MCVHSTTNAIENVCVFVVFFLGNNLFQWIEEKTDRIAHKTHRMWSEKVEINCEKPRKNIVVKRTIEQTEHESWIVLWICKLKTRKTYGQQKAIENREKQNKFLPLRNVLLNSSLNANPERNCEFVVVVAVVVVFGEFGECANVCVWMRDLYVSVRVWIIKQQLNPQK